jgi:hypothetical protein
MTNPAPTTEAENLEKEGQEACRQGSPLFWCPYKGECAEYWADGWWMEYRKSHPPLRRWRASRREHPPLRTRRPL